MKTEQAQMNVWLEIFSIIMIANPCLWLHAPNCSSVMLTLWSGRARPRSYTPEWWCAKQKTIESTGTPTTTIKTWYTTCGFSWNTELSPSA